jgi:signal transduction histidine kinase
VSGSRVSRQWYWMPTAVFLMGMFSIMLLLWVNRISESQRVNSLILDAVMDIQIHVATGHLWLEETVSGDDSHKEALSELDQAINLAVVAVNGGKSEHGFIPEPLKAPKLRAQAEAIRSMIVKFRKLALERLQNPEKGGVGSLLDQQFDAAFKEILKKAGALEDLIEESSTRYREQSARIVLHILSVWTIIVIVTTAGLRSRERRRKTAEEALLKANGQLLSQAEELTEHRERLSERVDMRTAELTSANELLQVEITERKRSEEELARRTRELARSNAELEQFAYVASHDLQEPLRMVTSYVQLLARRYAGRLDADADQFIAYAAEGAIRMQTLICDLLALSLVEAGRDEMAEVDSGAALKQAMERLNHEIGEQEAVITHDPLPTVVADDTQLGRLFEHLLGNAIKFRGEEPPRVSVKAERSGSNWLFSVSDNGIGIEPEYFDRIFRLFQRLNNREQYPGTGIGLAECRKIVERHGGGIWVESEPGSGATFFFTLPAMQEGNDEKTLAFAGLSKSSLKWSND